MKPSAAVSGAVLPCLLALAGCGSGGVSPTVPVTTPSSTLFTYFSPAVTTTGTRATFTIDHTADTFVQYGLLANSGNEQYVANSGPYTVLPNGIDNIGITFGGGNGTQGTLYNPPQAGNYAVELTGEIALVGLLNQPFAPAVPNQVCPSYASAQAFEFVTLPNTGDKAGTAYGTASLATGSGGAVSFTAINQRNIAGSTATNPSAASVPGTCSPTFYGQTISVPNSSIVTNPGPGQTVTASATIAVDPAGFLVEDNGYTPNPVTYQNVLGAGSGALGFAVPSSPLTTSALVGARYNGFIYNTGAAGNNIKSLPAVPSASRIASLGFPSVSAACATLPAPQTATVLYGGEFSANNPTASTYGNCDVALDVGAQSTQTNGLYPAANITLGAGFPGNTTGKAYSFSAVAIATLVNGKFAIFVIGYDAAGLQIVSQGQQTQDWGFYFLQSN